MIAGVDNFLKWLDAQSWSVALRESTWMYPIIETVHVLTIVGFAILLDLAVVGCVLDSAVGITSGARASPSASWR